MLLSICPGFAASLHLIIRRWVRYGVGRRKRRRPEVRLAIRSGGPVDRSSQGPGILRLRQQLPHRREGRHHHGCRGNPRHPPGRGWRGPNHDRAAPSSASPSSPNGSLAAYGSGASLDWLVNEAKITPHIPVNDKSKREDGTFSREDFPFDKERNVYICPAGKVLTTTGKLASDGETLYYRPRARDCRGCPLKPQCCPKAPVRRIPRSLYEPARDVARAVAKTEAFEQSRRDRKRVEMLFAHLKRILRLGRLRLRGPMGAQFEFTLSAIAQNLKRLAKLLVRPPPAAPECFRVDPA
jgi:Transposase DDE domain